MLCDILKCHGSQRAVHLSLVLMLLHQCNMEAIALARESSGDGGLLSECLAHSSNLLPSVKQTVISSDELVKQMNFPGIYMLSVHAQCTMCIVLSFGFFWSIIKAHLKLDVHVDQMLSLKILKHSSSYMYLLIL